MTKIRVLPKLTKKYILDRIKQEKIMELYTTIPVDEHTLSGNSFTSPLRKDNNPTCNYYYNERGKLRLKDWRGDFDGDVFDIVGHFEKINPRTPQGFQLIIHIIAKRFSIHKYRDGEEKAKLDEYLLNYKEKQPIRTFKVAPRAWNRFDKRYWSDKYGIGSKLLRAAKVVPVSSLHIEEKDGFIVKKYDYKSSDPAYAYYGGRKEGKVIWKIYFPYRRNTKMSKFMTNATFLQGEHLLLPSRVGIITKSYKDVLAMKTFGLQAIALAAESIPLTREEWLRIKPYCDIWISVLDYDKAGILMANKLKHTFGISPLMFTNGRYGQPDYGVKDFSDFRDTFGKSKTKQLIQSQLHKYKEQLDLITLNEYNNLKFTRCLNW